MKKVSTKALMVMTLMVASFTAAPLMAAGYDYDNDFNFDQLGVVDSSSLIGGFGNILGNIFRGLGPGGNVLATVFEMLFVQTLTNFSGKEILPGVYALSATYENSTSGSRGFAGEKDIYMLPYDYYESGVYDPSSYGYAYCEVTTTGSYEFNYTVGAGVTLIIWDNDGSFVNAVKKVIAFYHKISEYIGDPFTSSPSTSAPSTSSIGGIPEDLIQEGVELITWFLIHINDIFTGEELFVLNPITWQKLEIKTSAGFSITKTWKMTNDWTFDNGNDFSIESMSSVVHGIDGSVLLDYWNHTARTKNDSYMSWLLAELDVAANVTKEFTSFTFDLFQLWVKNFEIHIDVSEILNLVDSGLSGGDDSVNPAAIFQGLDIEFYLFTHHLSGAFLYNDTATGPVPDGRLSANYTQVTDNLGDPVFDAMGDPVEVPHSSELTHRLMLGSVDDFDFSIPSKEGNSISWGLRLDQATLTPVPVGVDLDSYLGASEESLAYIHFGFTFEPREVQLATTDGSTVSALHGAVKLDQFFAPWNNESTPYHANNQINGLDLAIIYVSTVLHFHLKIDTLGDDPSDPLDPLDDYDEEEHTLKIGNYLPHNIRDKLPFVDIAGPEYYYGPEGTTNRANASTSTLPVALFEVEAEAHETFEGTEDVNIFAADIGLNITFSVMVYAVCFPMFEDGSGIWHDPTFSVFMTFEPTGFWALILLVAGVGLVGVATILIKRRKDMRF